MWSKVIKKLVCLHLIVAGLLVVIALRDKETQKTSKDMFTAAMVLLSIATAVTFLGMVKCIVDAAEGPRAEFTRI